MAKESTATDQRRDLISYALKKANNGDWFYKTKQIITILRETYKGDLTYADATIEKKIGEIRRGVGA